MRIKTEVGILFSFVAPLSSHTFTSTLDVPSTSRKRSSRFMQSLTYLRQQRMPFLTTT